MPDTEEDIMECLCPTKGWCPYPATPEVAANLIVAGLLADLSPERQARIRTVIERWSTQRERAVITTTMHR